MSLAGVIGIAPEKELQPGFVRGGGKPESRRHVAHDVPVFSRRKVRRLDVVPGGEYFSGIAKIVPRAQHPDVRLRHFRVFAGQTFP